LEKLGSCACHPNTWSTRARVRDLSRVRCLGKLRQRWSTMNNPVQDYTFNLLCTRRFADRASTCRPTRYRGVNAPRIASESARLRQMRYGARPVLPPTPRSTCIALSLAPPPAQRSAGPAPRTPGRHSRASRCRTGPHLGTAASRYRSWRCRTTRRNTE